MWGRSLNSSFWSLTKFTAGSSCHHPSKKDMRIGYAASMLSNAGPLACTSFQLCSDFTDNGFIMKLLGFWFLACCGKFKSLSQSVRPNISKFPFQDRICLEGILFGTWRICQSICAMSKFGSVCGVITFQHNTHLPRGGSSEKWKVVPKGDKYHPKELQYCKKIIVTTYSFLKRNLLTSLAADWLGEMSMWAKNS